MSTDDFLRLDLQLCFPLYAASRAMVQAYTPLLAKLGLTYPQYLVMLVLWETDGVSVKELGEKLYLDSGTLTPLLKRLETLGFVRRERSKEDARSVTVSLTAPGKALRRKAASIPEAIVCRTGLSLEELARLRRDIQRLFEKVSRSA
ncbi:MarR family transcriptional regulator [Corallococcus sp. CA054B]|uniref:MarR family winged helix-turn-helix transcriptional regulator n=1 Tax=unclassified Corallococcus TaxID=2685029 RepID=UPI000EA1C311|nr:MULTISPECIES: MarR family transcriptional regulator [unclassified Corallococcus]NOJ98102.1 MarR family transcriptional regulator [Corallococcus coralloides]RKG61044.1 MarR family transcriptional regulator [Corallococcus sp. AB011P]RKG62870.1 MarR family transcriptional regulator [Corallococcus sp. CA054B]RKG85568.1 MarR family transcriptional regulator [Corallococcus sp. CA049B]RKH91912.1 MarR family transcriptional regulator [Corallococcus sp. AB045]